MRKKRTETPEPEPGSVSQPLYKTANVSSSFNRPVLAQPPHCRAPLPRVPVCNPSVGAASGHVQIHHFLILQTQRIILLEAYLNPKRAVLPLDFILSYRRSVSVTKIALENLLRNHGKRFSDRPVIAKLVKSRGPVNEGKRKQQLQCTLSRETILVVTREFYDKEQAA